MIKDFSVATEDFSIVTELAKAGGNYVTIEQVYVVIELARLGRISAATELATTGSFVAHDRDKRAKVMHAR